ncbi:unnamed protein product [Urochloa decumbens]|uniref:Trimethylguanosine synthase n=1 Tax=Urochloa decumbens TaxID=240449 RepID=A0ABC9A267_9POAL
MANRRAAALALAPARRRRVPTVTPFPTHCFLRLLHATARRRRRRLAAGSSTAAAAKHWKRSPPPRPEAEAQVSDAATDEAEEAVVAGKYWAQRHSLFSLYDLGVRMDAEGWYSATPESIAATQAARAAPGDRVVDAFSGCGGNAIQFAARGCRVVAVEIDPRKAELAAHNARIYGVQDRIQFLVGDFYRLAPFLKADVVFLSPPWGGPSYIQAPVYTLDMLQPKDGHTMFHAALKISPNIITFLPRTVDMNQVRGLSRLSCPHLDFESEENYVNDRLIATTAYFGKTARS